MSHTPAIILFASFALFYGLAFGTSFKNPTAEDRRMRWLCFAHVLVFLLAAFIAWSAK